MRHLRPAIRLAFRFRVVLNEAFSPELFQIWISIMASLETGVYEPAVGAKRTAILVVHGIGSQRALETVRGVIRGIWQDHNNPADKANRLWLHPEKDGADI